MKKIFIKLNEAFYKFGGIEVSAKDGSVYTWILRDGTSDKSFTYSCSTEGSDIYYDETLATRAKRKKISYHTSGRIHFENLSLKRLNGPPLTRITGLFEYFLCQIPSIDKLDVVLPNSIDTDACVIELVGTEFNMPFVIGFYVAESGYSFKEGIVLAEITNVFSCGIFISKRIFPIPEELEKAFHFFSPQEMFPELQIDEHNALIEFHKRITGVNGQIIYSSNKDGVFTLVYNTPKRIPPQITFEFEDLNLRIEEVSKSEAHFKFRIRDVKNRKLAVLPKIKSVTLDAELPF